MQTFNFRPSKSMDMLIWPLEFYELTSRQRVKIVQNRAGKSAVHQVFQCLLK